LPGRRPDLATIHRDFGPADLAAVAGIPGPDRLGAGAVPADDRDTDWLLDFAGDEPLVLAVVGWAIWRRPTRRPASPTWRETPKLRGLRPMLQNLDDDAWIAAPDLDPALDAMVAHGLSLDALVLTRHLPHLLTLARRRPDLAIVIDHGAKPPIAVRRAPRLGAGHRRLGRPSAGVLQAVGTADRGRAGPGGDALAPYVPAWSRPSDPSV
jgi:L-fuconolactonase